MGEKPKSVSFVADVNVAEHCAFEGARYVRMSTRFADDTVSFTVTEKQAPDFFMKRVRVTVEVIDG